MNYPKPTRPTPHAVEVCDRLVRELEEQLKGSKYDGKADTDAGGDC